LEINKYYKHLEKPMKMALKTPCKNHENDIKNTLKIPLKIH
jgi:hypothetical protein